jgi:hypothetical protein
MAWMAALFLLEPGCARELINEPSAAEGADERGRRRRGRRDGDAAGATATRPARRRRGRRDDDAAGATTTRPARRRRVTAVALADQAPALVYAILLPGLIAHAGFGVLSGLVTAPLVRAISGENRARPEPPAPPRIAHSNVVRVASRERLCMCRSNLLTHASGSAKETRSRFRSHSGIV